MEEGIETDYNRVEEAKEEEENEIDFLTLFFTGCAGSDSRP